MIPDSASELNSLSQPVLFTIVLKDSKGNEARLTTAPNQNVLSCYPGKLSRTVLSEDFVIEYWTPTTPLGMLNIPLSYFASVDLTAIQSIELIFDGNDKCAIFISAWELQ